MQKIPTIYIRDPATNLKYVSRDPHPDCGWVFDGYGTPTFKWDGTAVLIAKDGRMLKRRTLGSTDPIPRDFVSAGPPDPETGKIAGWVETDPDNPADQWHFEGHFGYLGVHGKQPPAGTYELVGPKVRDNPHNFERHRLIRHGSHTVGPVPVPLSFDQLWVWLHERALAETGFEGVVWHHEDGRMAKIKVRDFRSYQP